MNSKEIREYKETLSLTGLQREILTGLLLGDGHLETRNDGKTYRLKVEHGEGQREYTKWLYSHFEEWVWSDMYEKNRKDGSVNYGFTTLSHQAFRPYAERFYSNGKKAIPDRKSLEKELTNRGLAVWFMDDGSKKSKEHRTFIIHTLAYTKSELEVMQNALRQKFGVETSLHQQKGTDWRLYILSESADRFRSIVEEYTVPSLEYKLR